MSSLHNSTHSDVTAKAEKPFIASLEVINTEKVFGKTYHLIDENTDTEIIHVFSVK